jgi:hypothetical protein
VILYFFSSKRSSSTKIQIEGSRRTVQTKSFVCLGRKRLLCDPDTRLIKADSIDE